MMEPLHTNQQRLLTAEWRNENDKLVTLPLECPIIWTVSGDGKVATLDKTEGQSVTVTGVAEGKIDVSASAAGLTLTDTIPVVHPFIRSGKIVAGPTSLKPVAGKFVAEESKS